MARNRQRARDRKQGRKTDGREQQPRREMVPDDWEHGSAEVDQVEASIIAGAEGEEADELDERELAQAAEEAAPPPAAADPAHHPVGGPKPGGSRFVNFLRACWAELQRVQWPDRRQVAQATAVVLGFVAIAGAYLGLADAVAQRIVDFII